MENKILKARLAKGSNKLPPGAGKTPRTEQIRVTKTKTKKLTKSSRSNQGIKSLVKEPKRATTSAK